MYETIPDEARKWGMACHLSALAMFTSIPFANIFGPLIVWLIKGKDHPFVEDQAKEALNFQISMTLYALICVPLMLILIGFLLLGIVLVADVILTIIAAVAAKDGKAYRYPLTFRFIK